jgi:ethanolamine-phosphate phospho-lyase
MKEEFILVSSDGPDRNVLKLKPPLVFSHENADHFVQILDEVLTEMNDDEVSENLK